MPPKAAPEDTKIGGDTELVAHRHRLMTDLMVMAVACDQTRIFNMVYSYGFSNTTKPGYDKPHHTATHEEPVDPAVGYQPNVHWFMETCLNGLVTYLTELNNIREGDKSYVSKVEIKGNTKTKDIVIRRELRAYPGESFSGAKPAKNFAKLIPT